MRPSHSPVTAPAAVILVLISGAAPAGDAQRGARGAGSAAPPPKVLQVGGPRDGSTFFNLVDHPETARKSPARSTGRMTTLRIVRVGS